MTQSEAQRRAKAKYYQKIKNDPEYKTIMSQKGKQYYQENQEKLNRLNLANKQIEKLKHTLILRESSASWKITAPLRFIFGIFSGR